MKRGKAGSKIVYTTILVNGNTPVSKGNALTVSTKLTGASTSSALSSCKIGATTFNAADNDLPANTALICTHEVTVTDADVLHGNLPEFSITATTTTTPAGGTSTTSTVSTYTMGIVGLYTLPKLVITPTWKPSDPKETGESGRSYMQTLWIPVVKCNPAELQCRVALHNPCVHMLADASTASP